MPRARAVRREDLLAHCLAKPGAWEDHPWGEESCVVKVGEKIFAFVGDATVGVKCGRDREEADEWLRRYPDGASVMSHIGRYGWNSLSLEGVPPDEVLSAVDDCYEQVVARLPKAQRPG